MFSSCFLSYVEHNTEQRKVILGDHTARAYGDDNFCFPTSLRLRLVAQQRGILSPAKFGRTFGGEVLLQAMLVPPQLPWPCLSLAILKAYAR